MKVKICGITTLEDALVSIDAGADLLGFNFYAKSPRFITPAACAAITHYLQPRALGVELVGVFVNAGQAEIETTLKYCGLDRAQLSGDEPPDLLHNLGERAYKAFRPKNETALTADLQAYALPVLPPVALIDANHPSLYGGSGQTADWGLAAAMARRLPILLAGGLTPDNVAEAILQVQPWGVDVASGVELAPGRKDPARVTAFIRAAKSNL